jgi:hypothetical protein
MTLEPEDPWKDRWMIAIWWFVVFIAAFIFLYWSAHADTHPPDIQNWFAYLSNHINGACCGEADGYPAEVVHMPSPPVNNRAKTDGVACITDPAGKDVVVRGVTIKTKHAVKGNLCATFSWDQLTQEKQGNPFDHAYVFVHLRIDDTIDYLYCVAPLPQAS